MQKATCISATTSQYSTTFLHITSHFYAGFIGILNMLAGKFLRFTERGVLETSGAWSGRGNVPPRRGFLERVIRPDDGAPHVRDGRTVETQSCGRLPKM